MASAVSRSGPSTWRSGTRRPRSRTCRSIDFLAERIGGPPPAAGTVAVYAGGGYYYPADDVSRLSDELRWFLDHGYTRAKIKIGGVPLEQDLRRVEAAAKVIPTAGLAVDAMNAYDARGSREAAAALAPHRLWWFEDICDPLDLETHAAVAASYPHPIAAGEALFSHGGGQAPRPVRGAAARPGHPPVRSRPLLRDSRIPGHHRVPGGAGVAAPGLLAARRPSVLAAPRGRARARRRRGQSALVRSVRGAPRRGRPRRGPGRAASGGRDRVRAQAGSVPAVRHAARLTRAPVTPRGRRRSAGPSWS